MPGARARPARSFAEAMTLGLRIHFQKLDIQL